MFITGNIFHLTQIEKSFCLTLSTAVPKMAHSPPPVRPKMVRYFRAFTPKHHKSSHKSHQDGNEPEFLQPSCFRYSNIFSWCRYIFCNPYFSSDLDLELSGLIVSKENILWKSSIPSILDLNPLAGDLGDLKRFKFNLVLKILHKMEKSTSSAWMLNSSYFLSKKGKLLWLMFN